MIAATSRFTDYSADGLVNPTDWSRQHETPTQDKPFVCWSNANRDWSEPKSTSFA
ncbi:hypothetical protein MXD62_24435 [Frankia sp. Mgl5]|uniref:hypothetical protein n=1 Tax=Frankia sp. Mgl5 TaxID=2933793 RepID=UPI00200BCBC2|nr:hypothetical protein [Frankia sp. Mgl5]MCK9930273.1 hypothetical protein [Frankia sp. Mgl5]